MLILCAGCLATATFTGQIDIPGIAGRSPTYIARQLYSFKTGIRKGPQADVMKAVAENLTEDDVIAIAAYIGSRDPS